MTEQMKLMRFKRIAAGVGTGLLGMTMFVTPVHANVKPEDQAAEAAADVAEETEPEAEETEEPMEPLTPDANLTTVDDINPVSTTGKQFMTVTTKQGDIFYIIVDRDKDGNENVHFLNQVDDADLQALLDDDTKKAEEEAAAAEAERKAQEEKEAEEQAKKEAEEAARKAAEDEEKSGSSSGAVVLLILLAACGAVGYLWYRTKGKKRNDPAVPDPDEGYNEDEDAYEYPEEAGEEETI